MQEAGGRGDLGGPSAIPTPYPTWDTEIASPYPLRNLLTGGWILKAQCRSRERNTHLNACLLIPDDEVYTGYDERSDVSSRDLKGQVTGEVRPWIKMLRIHDYLVLRKYGRCGEHRAWGNYLFGLAESGKGKSQIQSVLLVLIHKVHIQ